MIDLTKVSAAIPRLLELNVRDHLHRLRKMIVGRRVERILGESE